MCTEVFTYTGASKNKTLNTTSHDQDKEKLLSHPGIARITYVHVYIHDYNDRQPDKPVPNFFA